MRSFCFVSAFVMVILCGQVSIPGPANAGCCYYPNCNCAGTKCSGGCPYCCGYRSPEIFQPAVLTGNPMWDNTVIQDPLPLTVDTLDITEQLANMTRGGECIHRRSTLRMLGNPEDAVKVASIGFQENNIPEKSLLFQAQNQ